MFERRGPKWLSQRLPRGRNLAKDKLKRSWFSSGGNGGFKKPVSRARFRSQALR